MSSKHGLRYLICLLLLMASGCYESDNPLSDARAFPTDRSVAGLWLSREDPNNDVYLHIIVDTVGRMKLIRVNHPQTQSGAIAGSEECDAFPTISAGQKFMNIRFLCVPADAEKEAPPREYYWFYRYELSGTNSLTIWETDYDALTDAITRQKANGKFWQTTWGSNIMLHESGDNLLKLLVGGKVGDLWKKYGTFQRLAIKDLSK